MHNPDSSSPSPSFAADGPLLILATAICLVAVLSPSPTLGRAGVPFLPVFECPFLWLTGHVCPLCGMTRAFIHMAHLSIVDAFLFNAAGCLLFLYFLSYSIAGWLYYGARWRHALTVMVLRLKAAPFLGALIIVQWLIYLGFGR